MNSNNYEIGIVGLGYVGLPLFCLFSQKYKCLGIDNDKTRILELKNRHDSKHVVCDELIKNSLVDSSITYEWEKLKPCNFYIVTVPTPIDNMKHPDTTALENACLSLSEIISAGDIIVFE